MELESRTAEEPNMKILVAYATTDGQTLKIVKFIAERIREAGHQADLFDTDLARRDVAPDQFDKVIVAGSVHQLKHQKCLEVFVFAKRQKLDAIPTLFVSVSLAAAFPDARKQALAYCDRFAAETGWTPDKAVCVAGAVRHEDYGYFREQILEHLVLEGAHYDDLIEDHEFTDWKAVGEAVQEFIGA